MTVVSSKEFAANQERYYDLAMNEQVFVQKDNIMFILTRANDKKKKHKKPDDDFRRAITMEEFKKRALIMVEKIDKMYVQ